MGNRGKGPKGKSSGKKGKGGKSKKGGVGATKWGDERVVPDDKSDAPVKKKRRLTQVSLQLLKQLGAFGCLTFWPDRFRIDYRFVTKRMELGALI